MIYTVGLGSLRGDITKRGIAAIKAAEVVFVRTLLTAAGKQVKKYNPVSMDDLYKEQDISAANEAAAERVLTAAQDGKNIVYCVDGSGYTDGSVFALSQKYPGLQIIAGVSEWMPDSPVSDVQIFSVQTVLEQNVRPDTEFPLLVYGLSSRWLAGKIKGWLLNSYGEKTEAAVITQAGAEKFPITEIDRAKKYGHNVYVFISAQTGFIKERYGYQDLMRIMERLTAPGGCPWDQEQTHTSIAKNAIEEANELSEAIALGDIDNMLEESGDVILQGVFHGDIGRRSGEFTTEDVIDRLCKKLVSRHTHVFGQDRAADAAEALSFWKAAKTKEKEKAKG